MHVFRLWVFWYFLFGIQLNSFDIPSTGIRGDATELWEHDNSFKSISRLFLLAKSVKCLCWPWKVHSFWYRTHQVLDMPCSLRVIHKDLFPILTRNCTSQLLLSGTRTIANEGKPVLKPITWRLFFTHILTLPTCDLLRFCQTPFCHFLKHWVAGI